MLTLANLPLEPRFLTARTGWTGRAGRASVTIVVGLAFAPDHEVVKPVDVQIRGVRGCGDRAILHDDDAVAYVQALGQPVRNQDEGGVVLQPPDEIEERLDLMLAEACRRFIQKDQRAFGAENLGKRTRSGDLDHLTGCDVEAAGLHGDVQRGTDFGELAFGRGDHLPFAQHPEGREEPLVGERQVRVDRQVGNKRGFLKHPRYADPGGIGRTAQAERAAVKGDGPRKVGYRAGQNVEQRGFAGAVLADQSDDLARAHVHREILQDGYAVETLGKTGNVKEAFASFTSDVDRQHGLAIEANCNVHLPARCRG